MSSNPDDKTTSEITNYLNKGIGAIQLRLISGKRTLLQRKMTNAFMKIVAEQGYDKASYTTTQAKLAKYSGFASNDNQYLKKTASSMLDAKVEFDVLNADNTSTVGATNLFSTIAFRSDGTVYVEVPELTKRMFSDSTRFAQINMQMQTIIDGNYAYAIYEQCTAYIDTGETPVWTLEVWKEILEISDDQTTYTEFKFFNNKIIKPAVTELNTSSDIIIEAVYHRTGRSVTSLSFKVKMKSQGLLDFFGVEESLNLQQRIVDFGVKEDRANELVNKYDRERIIRNIEYTENQLKLNNIKQTVSGFLIAAIEKDYSPQESEMEKRVKQKIEEDKQKKSAKEEEKAQIEKEGKSAFQQTQAKAQQYYDSLDETAKSSLKEDFIIHLSDTNKFILGVYKKKGIDNAQVKAELQKFIKTTILKLK